MIEQLKWYLVNVGLKKYVPVGAMAALAALGTFMAAHAGVLEQYGVTYGTWPFVWPAGQAPSGPCLLVEMDTLSKAAIAGIFALVAVLTRATEHHAVGAVTSNPPPAEVVPGGPR